MTVDLNDTAVVFIDPQIDVLSPAGRNWATVGASVTENNTVAHMLEIFGAAAHNGYPVLISPSGATHWSCRTMAKLVGVSSATVQRIWSDLRLQPHRV